MQEYIVDCQYEDNEGIQYALDLVITYILQQKIEFDKPDVSYEK